MPRRPTLHVLAAAALLAAACAPESPLVSASTTTQFAKGGGSGGGSTPAPVASVAGTWTGTVRRTASPGDTTRWSLSLTQKDERVEGSLIRIAYFSGGSSAGASSIKKGSVAGQSVTVSFAGGEGAETKPTFSATVSADGRSMTGYYSYLADPITLTRR